jgi:hypothetical protein
MRFVPVKSADQQAMLSVHRLREGWKEERTACINRIRGLLAEYVASHHLTSGALVRVLPGWQCPSLPLCQGSPNFPQPWSFRFPHPVEMRCRRVSGRARP